MNAKAASPIKAARKPAVQITRGDDLAGRLAADIAASVFAPGCRLEEVTLAARYGASRTPVREALRQLEAAGLVERRPYRGAVVSSPTQQRLAEMFVAAGELEASCARLAAKAMTAPERSALRRAHDKMGELACVKDREAYLQATTVLHERLYAGAHNDTVAGFARDLRRRLIPFRRAQLQTTERLAQSFADHEEIVRAIERHDADSAASLMRHHLQSIDRGQDAAQSTL